MRKINVVFLVLFLLNSFGTSAQNETFSKFRVDTMLFESKRAYVVVPEIKDKKGKWIWRARFWGHQGQTDIALLEKGYHVVYVDVAGLFGNEEAVERWNSFYHFARNQYSLNTKVALEGMSRGGLIIYNWAAENTDKVACIYADAPVCDLRSWPGGKFSGKGSEADWKKALKAHGQTEASIDAYQGVPIYTAVKAAKSGIPSLNICGGADQVVPFAENTEILASKYIAGGGTIEVIVKEGVGHHPHSLKDPSLIVDFIEAAYLETN